VTDRYGLYLGACSEGKNFCGANNTCLRYDQFCDHSMKEMVKKDSIADDWRSLCDIKQFYSTRLLESHRECTECSNCPADHYYCQLSMGCLPDGHPCTNKGICTANQYKCHDRCIEDGIPCCDMANQEVCHSSCIPKGSICRKEDPKDPTDPKDDGKKYCFEDGDGECSKMLGMDRQVCSGYQKVCKIAEQQKTVAEQVKSLSDQLKIVTVCEDDAKWCPFTLECMKSNHSCSYYNKTLQVKKNRRTPWGEYCDDGDYCPFTGTCIDEGVKLSLIHN
jgi:hypothetical protein